MTLGSSSAATVTADTCMSTKTPACVNTCQEPSPEFSCNHLSPEKSTLCVSLDELHLWRPNGGCYGSSGSFYSYGIKHATAAPLEVQLRSAKDRFIAAQRITEGTMEFGLPSHLFFTIAFICLGITGPFMLYACVFYVRAAALR